MNQLDPKSVYLFFFTTALSTIAIGSFLLISVWSVLITIKNPGTTGTAMVVAPYDVWGSVFISIPVFLIIGFIWAKLTYHFYRYELTDSGFKKESGVIYKKYVTIPYDRIQNVDIYRGILARILGLSDLQIQTAGASAVVGRYGAVGNAEGALPGISREVAEQLRDELIQRSRQARNQGL